MNGAPADAPVGAQDGRSGPEDAPMGADTQNGAQGLDAPLDAPGCTHPGGFRARAGWRTEVRLGRNDWRYAKGSKTSRRTGKYRPLGQVPGGEERIDYAKQNSEKQRAQKARAKRD